MGDCACGKAEICLYPAVAGREEQQIHDFAIRVRLVDEAG